MGSLVLVHCKECGYPKRIDLPCEECNKKVKCLGSPKPKCKYDFGICVGCFLNSGSPILAWTLESLRQNFYR